MKKYLIIILIINTQILFSQDKNKELIKLAKIYRYFSFTNEPTEKAINDIENIKLIELKNTGRIIKEFITTNNKLTTKEFLTIPDSLTLYNLYIIKRINWNIRKEEPKNNDELIKELIDKKIPRYELVENYYNMLYSGVGNKNRPNDLSDNDFQIDEYKLHDETEKGIFFLTTMKLCHDMIWGYMNIVKPPNYKKVGKNIKRFPKFNGLEYYKYLDFSFPDFKMKFQKDKEAESYKYHMINYYYETLIYNYMFLSQKRKYKKEKENLALSSILREQNYYKYSKNQEFLNKLFHTIEMN